MVRNAASRRFPLLGRLKPTGDSERRLADRFPIVSAVFEPQEEYAQAPRTPTILMCRADPTDKNNAYKH